MSPDAVIEPVPLMLTFDTESLNSSAETMLPLLTMVGTVKSMDGCSPEVEEIPSKSLADSFLVKVGTGRFSGGLVIRSRTLPDYKMQLVQFQEYAGANENKPKTSVHRQLDGLRSYHTYRKTRVSVLY